MTGARMKREARALEYRTREADSAALARDSTLDHVREKHQRAAARWGDLAALDEHEGSGAVLRQAAIPPA